MMGYYQAGDPGLFDWLTGAAKSVGNFFGSAATGLGNLVIGAGSALGFTGPAQLLQRWQQTGNPISSLVSVAQERGWGGAALDVARGLGTFASGGAFGAAGATAAQLGLGLFSQTEPPSQYMYQPPYMDVMTGVQPPPSYGGGYSTGFWDAPSQYFSQRTQPYYANPYAYTQPASIPPVAYDYAYQEPEEPTFTTYQW